MNDILREQSMAWWNDLTAEQTEVINYRYFKDAYHSTTLDQIDAIYSKENKSTSLFEQMAELTKSDESKEDRQIRQQYQHAAMDEQDNVVTVSEEVLHEPDIFNDGNLTLFTLAEVREIATDLAVIVARRNDKHDARGFWDYIKKSRFAARIRTQYHNQK